MSNNTYLLDANVFITAYRQYYGFDIAPSFWQMLQKFGDSKQVVSLKIVKNELCPSKKIVDKDALQQWIEDDFTCEFHAFQEKEVIQTFGQLVNSIENSTVYSDAAKEEVSLGKIADPWLVSYAKVHDYTLVTLEVYNPDIKRKVPMPNMCKLLGVKYINTFDMIRQLKQTF